MWEAMTIATWLLARTQSLVVGHLVLCDALRHPAVLARQAATLDHASGGRYELGIGWGSVPDELDTFGVGAGAGPRAGGAPGRVPRRHAGAVDRRAGHLRRPVLPAARCAAAAGADAPHPDRGRRRRRPDARGGPGARRLVERADPVARPARRPPRPRRRRPGLGAGHGVGRPDRGRPGRGHRARGPPFRRLDHGRRRRRRHHRRAGPALRGPPRPRASSGSTSGSPTSPHPRRSPASARSSPPSARADSGAARELTPSG